MKIVPVTDAVIAAQQGERYISLNCTLKNGSGGTFYVIYILSQLKVKEMHFRRDFLIQKYVQFVFNCSISFA